MELWVAIRGVYDDARPVGVADSEEAARQLVREAYWTAERIEPEDRCGDPLKDHWDAGSVDGPFKLGELRTEPLWG